MQRRALSYTSGKIGDIGDLKVPVEALYTALIAILSRIGEVVRQVQRLCRCDGRHDDRCSSTGVHMLTFQRDEG